MNNKGKVLIAAPVHSILTDGLLRLGYHITLCESITRKDASALLADCTGIITSTRLLLDKELIDAAPYLQWIGRMGSGMEIIDTTYAASRNIACFSSPDGISNAVGEHALGMLLNLLHKINNSNNELRQGIWLREENRGMELEGKTIGIIGFGHTGRAFAQKLQGFDVQILVYDKKYMDYFPPYVTPVSDLFSVFEQAEIISFHVPLLEDTAHYFNAAFLDAMQHPFILLNTSRGKIVDTAVMYKGLQSGKIIGACIDVFETEPVNIIDNSLIFNILSLKNVVATPHIAGYTHEAVYKMSRSLLMQLQRHLNGL